MKLNELSPKEHYWCNKTCYCGWWKSWW